MSLPRATGRSATRQWLFGVVLSVIVGGLISVQAIVNGTLRVRIDDPLLPSLANFVVAGVLVGVVLLVRRSSHANVGRFIAQLRSGTLTWVVLTAGLFGMVFSISQAISVMIIGVAVFTVAVIAGQNLGGLAVDRRGIGGSGVHRLDLQRVLAAVIATLAVVVAVIGRLGQIQTSALLIAFVVIGGACAAIQLALSGRITVAVADPFVSAMNVFLFGTIGLLVAVGVRALFEAPHIGATFAAIADSPWLVLGGVCAAVMMTLSATAVPLVGVLVFTMSTVIGQLLVALLIDAIVGTQTNPVTLVIACVLTLASVIMAGRSAQTRRRRAHHAATS